MAGELAGLRARLHERERLVDAFDLLPDLWRDIYGAGPGFLSLFSGVRPEPAAELTTPHQAYFAWPGETAPALGWIAREVEQDRELYHCAHLVRRWRRRKEDAAPLASLYVDLDRQLPDEFLLPPSIIVASSPERFQLYFRLTRPVEPARGAALNRRLALALGGDAGGWDLTQLLRIPGTVNHKYRDRPTVQLVRETSARYDPREVEGFLPAGPPLGQPRRARLDALPPVGSEPPVALTRPARAIWDGEDVRSTPDGRVDRSASLVRIARILLHAGLAPEHIAAVLADRDRELGWEKYTGRPNAAMHYHRIVDVVQRGAPTRHNPRPFGQVLRTQRKPNAR